MAGSLSIHGELQHPSRSNRYAVASHGFRPFFLLAAMAAVLLVPLWLAVLSGYISVAYLAGPVWHGHEMIFGFATAVVAGFLLTATANWTGRVTLVGTPLLGLAGVWVMGRCAMLLARQLPPLVVAFADLVFLPLVIVALARPIIAAKSRRNFVMLGVLAALFACNVMVHLDALGVARPGSASHACAVAIDIVLIVISIIAGRVFPMFTRNATGVPGIRNIPLLDAAALIALALLTLVDVTGAFPRVGSALAGVAGALAAARAVRWGAQHSRHDPMLWILHAGWGWLTFGLLLRAAAPALGPMPGSLATHALTAGAIGSLTLGMMARVSLGHTGRRIEASRLIHLAFVAITAAASIRVVVPLVAPGAYLLLLQVSGALWAVSFIAFLLNFLPILTSPRLDGNPG